MSAIGWTTAEFPVDLLLFEIVKYFREQILQDELETNNTGATSSSARNSYLKPDPVTKLEAIGYRVGYPIIEKLCKEHPRFNTELDSMKFICKEFWSSVFHKQVDNLRTNHQGVYVIQDSQFHLILPISTGEQFRTEVPVFLAFPCGLIRGALANLGYTALVSAEIQQLPAVRFHVTVQQK